MDDITIIGTVLHSVQACTSSFVFPSEVTQTNDGGTSFYVFKDVSDVIEQVIFEENSELIGLGSYTFYQCSKIREIDLSNCKKLSVIGMYCFYSCSSLSKVILPSDGVVSTINSYAFGMTSITDFHLPQSISFCGWYIFLQCAKIKNVTTVKDVKFSSLWTFAFSTSSIEHFIIPKAVKSVSGNSLQNNKIASYEIDPDNPYFSVYEGCLYSKNMTILHSVPSLSTSVSFHPNCTMLQSRPFMWSSITDIVIPSNINVFCTQCFYLSSVKNVTILNATEIPVNMFYQCTSLTNLTLPPNVEILGKGFITYTKLGYLFVPKSVIKLDDAFSQSPKNLVVEFENGSTFSYENGYLYNQDKTRLHSYMGADTSIEIIDTIEAIDGSVFSGKSAIYSITFKGQKVKELGIQCFEATTGLATIDLPSSIKILNFKCFASSGLKSIVIPGSIISVSESCFSGCVSLETVSICEGVSSIQSSCFNGCTKLTTINFPSTLESILDFAFYKTGLKNLIFGSSLSSARKKLGKERDKLETVQLSIQNNAFSQSLLESISFTGQVSSIGVSAFQDCALLTHVDIMETPVTELSSLTFSGCSKLSSIYFPHALQSIGDECFEGCGFERLSIPASVSKLGSRAVGGNKKLVSISLASNTSLSAIVSTSFRGCTSLREFVFDGKSWTYSSVDGVLINSVTRTLCIYPPAHKCSGSICRYYEAPLSVTSIGSSAFLDSSLETIKLHSGVVEICAKAFDSCQKLKRLIIESTSLGVGVLSFDGIVFDCGFIKCSASIFQQLENVGVPTKAVLPCPTDFPSLVTLNFFSIGQGMLISEE